MSRPLTIAVLGPGGDIGGELTEVATEVGLLPGERADEANEHLSIALRTGLGQLRNGVLVSAADAAIAVGGSWGTLSEVALALRTGRPVVCLRGWRVFDAAGQPLPVPVAESGKQAVALLFDALDRQRRG